MFILWFLFWKSSESECTSVNRIVYLYSTLAWKKIYLQMAAWEYIFKYYLERIDVNSILLEYLKL